MAIKTTSKIPVYEIDGSDSDGLDKPHLELSSHWNYTKDRVVLHMADGKKLTVVARDLENAIRACTTNG